MEKSQKRDLDLAGQRIAKGISLRRVESSTRISPHFLRAIEAEQFDKLPGGVYAVSYLRQYAREIGFDEAVLLDRYHQVVGPKAPVEAATTKQTFLRRLAEPLRFLLGHSGRNHAQPGPMGTAP
jgi:cytoskeletal protein RodZ